MWDNATRGPFGASVILGRLQGKELLASLGALMVVFALAVDPFAQQIIRYKDCAVTIPGTAKLPRANSFGGGGYRMGVLSQSIAPGEQKAINASMFNPSSSTWFDCSSGNCTWSTEYSTTAWCSSCQDITDQLIVTKTSRYNVEVRDNGSTSTTSDESTYVGYILETSVDGGIAVSVSSTGSINPEWEYAAMGPAPDDSVPEFGSVSIDYIIGAKALECDDNYIADHWPCNGPADTRCTFAPCVKTFTAFVANGRITETLIDTGYDWGSSGSGGAMLDLKCLDPSELISSSELGYIIKSNQRYLAYNLSVSIDRSNIDDAFLKSMILRNCLYSTGISWLSSVRDHLHKLLNGTAMGYIPTNSTPQGLLWGPQVVQTLFDFGSATDDSIRDTFANISTLLTNYMRENGSPLYHGNTSEPVYSDAAQGTVQHSKVCIRIRWGWFAYPVALVVSTLVFFVALLVETTPSKYCPRIWESSPLALLYHGLASENAPESSAAHRGKALDELRTMEAAAKTTSVRLECSDNGYLQLVEQGQVDYETISN